MKTFETKQASQINGGMTVDQTRNGKATASSVLDVVREIGEHELNPVAPANAGIAFQPRTLLAVLTYYYATGVYASREIESIMRQDVNFRIVCANEFPDSQTIRRFRRCNHDVIQRCLDRVFHPGEAHPRIRSMQLTETGNTSTGDAAHCLEEVMFVDQMTDD